MHRCALDVNSDEDYDTTMRVAVAMRGQRR